MSFEPDENERVDGSQKQSEDKLESPNKVADDDEENKDDNLQPEDMDIDQADEEQKN